MDMKKFCPAHEPLLACVGLFVVALAIRLISLSLEPQIPRDAVLYLGVAEGWFHGGTLDALLEAWTRLAPGTPFYPPPLFFFLIKLGMSCGLTAEGAGKAISVFTGSLVPVMVYLAVCEWTPDRRIRYGAALLALFHPGLVDFSRVPLRGELSVFLVSALVWLFSRMLLGDRKRDWIAAGTVWCAAVLTRYENWEFLLILFGIVFFQLFAVRKMAIGGAFAALARFGASAMLFLLLFGFASGFGPVEFADCGVRYLHKQWFNIQSRWEKG